MLREPRFCRFFERVVMQNKLETRCTLSITRDAAAIATRHSSTVSRGAHVAIEKSRGMENS